VTPPVCVWKRIFCERSDRDPNRSRTIFAHIRRTARNFAISWKTLLWQLKKKASRGANSSIPRPRASAASVYAIALASVKATSWTAEQPFSRM
jgi:hypothetical protein